MGRWRTGLGIGLAVSALAGAGAAAGTALSGTALSGGPGSGTKTPTSGLRLVSYDGCPQMLAQLRSESLPMVGPDGFTTSSGGSGRFAPTGLPMGVASGGAMAAAPLAGGAASGSAAAPSGASTPGASGSGFSTTNNQEAGVDEPDLTKTDGRLLLSLERMDDTLHVTDVGSAPGLVGSLDLSAQVQATGMFLVGSDAVVLGSAVSSPSSSGAGGAPVAEPAPALPSGTTSGTGAAVGATPMVVPVGVESSTTQVVVVDLSAPANPKVARSFSLQGNEVDARLVNGIVEVVVSSSPQLPFVVPADGSAGAVAAATATNRNVVLSASAADWLPSVKSEPSGATTVAPCTSAMHTVSTAGVDTIGVVPIDPSSAQPGSEVTVVGDATTVYTSTSSLYVAFTTSSAPVATPSGPVAEPMQPVQPSADDSTTIDKFDLSNPTAPSYIGSGDVPGSLIGQYALSEYQGDLRVATTLGQATPPPGEGTAPSTLSDNRITVLADQSGTLTPVGSVTGLGTGEKIYAVRFEGPLAYVVTFNQTDPLFVIDLHDPTNPKATGQLPLTGYSSFLQPVGDGLLLGVGQDVNSNLRTDGLQVSLFDVSDPANPKLLGKQVIANASSNAQNDPHALLYWASTGLVVLPVDEYGTPVPMPMPMPEPTPVPAPSGAPGPSDPTSPFVGAIAWHVSSGGLQQAGQISQPPVVGGTTAVFGGSGDASIERAVVVGDKLYTVSETGILVSDLSSLSQLTWMPYPAPPSSPVPYPAA